MESSSLTILTAIVAAIGAVLGIINTWSGLNQRRVKLKVIPKTARLVVAGELGPEMGCIDVTNLSAFPITVREVGFTIEGDPRTGKRAAVITPILVDGGAWPRRLEARTSVSVYFDWSGIASGIKKAYAFTDCGEVAYGDSPALRDIRSRT